MKRHRRSFPDHVDFTGWWIKSRTKGCVAQLIRSGRNLHEQNMYALKYENEQIGAGRFTIQSLVEQEVTIRLEKEDLNEPTPPNATPRKIAR